MGCSNPPQLTRGTVVSKHHVGAYSYLKLETYSDEDGDIHTRFRTEHEPDRWVVRFEGKLADETTSREVDVTEEVYNRTEVGSEIDIEPAELPR